MKYPFFIWALTFFLSYTISSYYQRTRKIQLVRTIASGEGEEEEKSQDVLLTSFEDIECMNEEEYLNVSKQIKLKDKIPGSLCGEMSYREKFAKILSLAKKMSLQLPKDYNGGAQDAITDPFAYIANNRSYNLDLNQKTSIAYNSNRGDIYLGGLFFLSSPLDSLLILIHESRHTSNNDPRHTLCLAGDIPGSEGGCDAWFRVDSKAGSYAYVVSFSLAQAKYNSSLSLSNKEYLIAHGISLLSRRFNAVPNWAGIPTEVILVLSTGNKFYLVHSITLKPTLLTN